MDSTGKPIVVSQHAVRRMEQRGATLEEIERAVHTVSWEHAQRGKWHARLTLPFDALSPVNGQHYDWKTIDVVFADDPASIVVVTVKAYYHN